MSVEIKRTNNTLISVKTQTAGNRVTADHFMWFAKELRKAMDEGMPLNAEVTIRNEIGVNGVTISATAILVNEIP